MKGIKIMKEYTKEILNIKNQAPKLTLVFTEDDKLITIYQEPGNADVIFGKNNDVMWEVDTGIETSSKTFCKTQEKRLSEYVSRYVK